MPYVPHMAVKQGVLQPTVIDQSALPGIPDPSQRTDNRFNYEDMDPLTNVTCATHSYGMQDQDSTEMWKEIIVYLKTDALPECCQDSAIRKSFIHWTKGFFLHDKDWLWKMEPQGKLPRLIIVDIDCHSTLVAEAHNSVGH